MDPPCKPWPWPGCTGPGCTGQHTLLQHLLLHVSMCHVLLLCSTRCGMAAAAGPSQATPLCKPGRALAPLLGAALPPAHHLCLLAALLAAPQQATSRLELRRGASHTGCCTCCPTLNACRSSSALSQPHAAGRPGQTWRRTAARQGPQRAACCGLLVFIPALEVASSVTASSARLLAGPAGSGAPCGGGSGQGQAALQVGAPGGVRASCRLQRAAPDLT